MQPLLHAFLSSSIYLHIACSVILEVPIVLFLIAVPYLYFLFPILPSLVHAPHPSPGWSGGDWHLLGSLLLHHWTVLPSVVIISRYFPKMQRGVGMAVPKTTETRCRDRAYKHYTNILTLTSVFRTWHRSLIMLWNYWETTVCMKEKKEGWGYLCNACVCMPCLYTYFL